MRKSAALLLAGLLAVAVVSTGSTTGAAATTGVSTVSVSTGSTPGFPRLQRDGRWLVDEHGRVVIVHGVNLVWKRPPYAPPDTPAGFTAADADFLHRYGFNGARLGVLWAGVNPTAPGVADPSYFAKVDRVADLLADRGIWTQFDMHQDMWNEAYGGEGVPAWALHRPLPYSLLPYTKVPFPFGYWTPEVSTVFDQFWANKDGLLDQWVTFWKQVATHYRDQRYSMGYDLFNEPWAGLEWPTCLAGGCSLSYYEELQPAQDRARAGIRSVDPASMVWYEPQQLAGGTTVPTYLKSVPGEANLGLSWHNYCSATFAASTGVPVDLTETCRQFNDNRHRNALKQAEQMQAAPLMSEWGATDNVRALQIDAQKADEYRMGWLYWAYKSWDDPTTADTSQGLFTDDADLSSVKQDKLRQLVRTYPQATAGVPVAYTYDDATGRFDMTWQGDASIDAPTRIFVSPLTSPHGFDVTTSAGTVTVDGSYVDIDARTDAQVHVTITPRP